VVTASFSHPVLSAQSTFRAILDAMARPGRVLAVRADVSPPPPLSPAGAAVALTLCDHDTPVWLAADLRASAAVGEWLRFHCGCDLVDDPADAAFALASGASDLPGFDKFNIGTPDYPDRSTTIVLQVQSLSSGTTLALTGPGIRDRSALQAEPLPPDMAERLAVNRRLFPCGIDLLLVAPTAVAALPRSVRVTEEG